MGTKEEAKVKVAELVGKYEVAKATGKLRSYSEEETKKDFILPLFEALGWSVLDKNEVTAEETISGDRVDYGFYIGRRVKFYLEAKKISADLNKPEFADQAVKYSWNKGATWAVLTDFESIKVFNSQVIDKSLADKMFFSIDCREYLDRFDQLWLLSRQAFEENTLDGEAEKYGKKLQRVSVNTMLYKELNECREILTQAFASLTDKMSMDLIDEGVQKVLDRLIFIRVVEDRGIEEPTLIPMLRQWQSSKVKGSLYKFMKAKFEELDSIYNSNIFAKHAFDNLEDTTNNIEYSDAIKRVVNILYGKPGYYEFDFKIMPADVLGSVYENYLGYKLEQAKKKPKLFGESLEIHKDSKKRKEQGIYYTPSYIVDYIVRNTIGPVLDKCHSIEDLKKIKILDPACGSGSFLVKALAVMTEKYIECGSRGDEFTKRTILLENIYGVDLDSQAIELARLNLLISAIDARDKLPSLAGNIKNGNSLISGTDKELEKTFGKNWRDKKPFNWQEEFPRVFAQGGFDVIIGNPPYISAVQDSNLDQVVRDYYKMQYSLNGAYDIYIPFLILGVRLTKDIGTYGWIIPNKLMVADYARRTLNLLKEQGENKIIDISKQNVFGHVGVYPIIIIGDKSKSGFVQYTCDSPEDLNNANFFIDVKENDKNYMTFLEGGIKIGSGATGFQAKALIECISTDPDRERIPFVVSGSVDPYHIDFTNVRYMGITYKKAYIKKGKGIAESKWKFWQQPKIVVAGMTRRIESCYFNDPLALGVGVYAIYDFGTYDPHFLTALLNSRYMTYVLLTKYRHKHLAGGYMAINKSTIEGLPIVKVDSKQQEVLINLSKSISQITAGFIKAHSHSNEWEKLKSEIEKTEKKIDEEVYKLYGLTPEEIEIVEKLDKK